MQQFTTTVFQTDGASFSVPSPLPLNRMDLVKDTVRHALWNPRLGANMVDATGDEFSKFRRKFVAGGGVDEIDLAALADNPNEALHVVQVQARPQAAASTGKKRRK
jgi:hypothetical protein